MGITEETVDKLFNQINDIKKLQKRFNAGEMSIKDAKKESAKFDQDFKQIKKIYSREIKKIRR